MPRIQILPAGMKLVPPIGLPLRSFGVLIPEVVLTKDEAVPETPMQEHRDAGDRVALLARYEIGADVFLADIEFRFPRQPPMPFARSHVGEKDELKSGGLDQAFLQRANDVVVTGRDRQSELRH